MDAVRRQNGESGTDKFLDLIADPFQAQVSLMLWVTNLPYYQTYTTVTGPRELHLCRYRLLLRCIRSAGHRILLPPPAKLPRLRTTSQTC
jgi:hypothetical protein